MPSITVAVFRSVTVLQLSVDLPRAFGTADLWLIHAADCCSRYSSWTWRPVLKSGVPTLRIVPEFDVPHNVAAGMFASRILGAVDALVLKRSKERLGHRIIVA